MMSPFLKASSRLFCAWNRIIRNFSSHVSSHLKTKQSLGHHLAVVGFLASVEEDGVVAVSVLILVPGGETVIITRTFTK